MRYPLDGALEVCQQRGLLEEEAAPRRGSRRLRGVRTRSFRLRGGGGCRHALVRRLVTSSAGSGRMSVGFGMLPAFPLVSICIVELGLLCRCLYGSRTHVLTCLFLIFAYLLVYVQRPRSRILLVQMDLTSISGQV